MSDMFDQNTLLKGLENLAKELNVNLVDLLSNFNDASQGAELSSAFVDKVIPLLKVLQVCVKTAEANCDRDGNTVAFDPPSSQTSEKREVAMPETQEKKRRKPHPAYDYLLLEGIHQSDSYGYNIGQSTLLKLAEAFDENTKKGSLVAKLGRMRNDLGLVEWQNSEALKLTGKGNEERKRLLAQCRRDKHLERVTQAFRDAWDYDLDVEPVIPSKT